MRRLDRVRLVAARLREALRLAADRLAREGRERRSATVRSREDEPARLRSERGAAGPGRELLERASRSPLGARRRERRRHVVLDAPDLAPGRALWPHVDDRVGGAHVPVEGATHRAHVDDEPSPLDLAHEGPVSVGAGEDLGARDQEERGELARRSVGEEDGVLVARRPVDDDDRPARCGEPVREREGSERAHVLAVEPVERPAHVARRVRPVHALRLVEREVHDAPVVVSADRRDPAIPQEREALAGLRPPPDHVSGADDPVHGGGVGVREHGLEGGEVPVDAAKDGDTHGEGS